MLIAACIFAVTMLAGMVLGAGVYRQVQRRAEDSALRRLGLSYLTAKVHGCDRAGAVRLGSFGDGDAVFLLREAGGASYETALYTYDGALMEAVYPAGEPVPPQAGQPITEMAGLTARREDGLLVLDLTDPQGRRETARIYLRSGVETEIGGMGA